MRRIATMMAGGLAMACAAGHASALEVEYARRAGEWAVVGARQGSGYLCQAMRPASRGSFVLSYILRVNPLRFGLSVGLETSLPAGSKVTGTITVDKGAAFPLEAATVSDSLVLLDVARDDWVPLRDALREGRQGRVAVVISTPGHSPETVTAPLDGSSVALDLASLCVRQMMDLAGVR